ncbi:BREX-1 system phosphatase PglZ type A [Anaerosalibacter bizertensis]|uniref:BREX-1 system phosphatase PglZ type A n=1 Tax=Anaerosalibacter bizertensis TaxID=932217 RepID=A0A9Q4AD14_9FIRM|nr:BREX-1 system phosphatase PglZ type A [Anaerosalibacter bizertensis]MBV1819080.1 BREX-1 system phosphatase PglZ type A [Bacteroidales bacterium MSK.15.36]MCB5559417.1 BREX-1 system phosphatase PglZ type A [Anaerosalibacter bizertensis]MCG4565365.1 BREX-1 system phosphatase PglZ type A [Anaerosalibacter bizertensis]MCG4582446.1 BREX-1 system phosphatase PglZ type A [Anaerosalibacter bizertensis]MCG4584496.1 BREX-1 system phosphatase PglZ type A [Anaerosalibacter bizertensis]
MKLDEVQGILEKNLNEDLDNGKKRNIVFWYDEDGEFEKDIDNLNLKNGKIVKLDKNNSFYIKYLLEIEDPSSNYLIYSPMAKPHLRDNWLLDILEYSFEFSTDKAELIRRDFVEDESLTKVFKNYLKFFNNKERYKKFASYSTEDWTEDSIHIRILSTLCKLPIADFEEVVKAVLMEELKEDNKYMKAIRNFGDEKAFWNLVEKRYGYNIEQKSLKILATMLLVTHNSYYLKEKIPAKWKKYLSSKEYDCIVFVSNFMNHTVHSEKYNEIADSIEKELQIEKYIDNWELDKYLDSTTFRIYDEKIIEKILQNISYGLKEYERYRKIINKRRTSHWFPIYKYEYEAIYYAMGLFEKEREILNNIKGKSSLEIVRNYTDNLYKIDSLYRKFYSSYDEIIDKDRFVILAEKVENFYNNYFLNELSIKWSQLVEDELLEDFTIKDIHHQKDFYKEFVLPFVRKEDRIFVIISDALRYEAGVELTELLNKDLRGSAEVEPMLGVVPSYTKLGMASLLPRKSIEIDGNGNILVDGINTQGTENREKILKNYSNKAMAIQYNDIVDMNRKEYEDTFVGKKLVYIYHNTIDALGDKAQTERDVFRGVKAALEDISNLVRRLVNNVSATNILVTADHGFIYRRFPLEEWEKIGKKAPNPIDRGRRFILEENMDDVKGTLPISTKYIFGEKSKFKAIVPKGIIRYKIKGAGANYVHGGAALQEIMVPVIKFKNIRKDEYKATKVEVKLTNISRKITNMETYLEFFQVDVVDDKKLPLKLKLYFADENGDKISNENIIIADSKSNRPEERIFKEKFTLKNINYDKTKEYYLIIEDINNEEIYEKIPFSINLIRK